MTHAKEIVLWSVGKTLYSHSAFLDPGVQTGNGKLNVAGTL